MYTLRFPFRLQEGTKINDLPVDVELDGLRLSMTFREPYYILTVDGFHTEDAAREAVAQTRLGLTWAMLQHHLPFQAEQRIDTPAYASDPIAAAENLRRSFGLEAERVDGLVDGNIPSVYPTDRDIRTITAGDIRIIHGVRKESVIAAFVEGFGLGNAHAIQADPMLQTALDLFRGHHFEYSPAAKLLSLTMVLEVLAPVVEKHTAALRLIERWRNDLEAERERQAGDSEAEDSLEALQRELVFRKGASLRSRVRALAIQSAHASNEVDFVAAGKRAVAVYDARSTLVHSGTLDREELGRAVADALDIARMVLRHAIRRSASAVA